MFGKKDVFYSGNNVKERILKTNLRRTELQELIEGIHKVSTTKTSDLVEEDTPPTVKEKTLLKPSQELIELCKPIMEIDRIGVHDAMHDLDGDVDDGQVSVEFKYGVQHRLNKGDQAVWLSWCHRVDARVQCSATKSIPHALLVPLVIILTAILSYWWNWLRQEFCMDGALSKIAALMTMDSIGLHSATNPHYW
eukprot:m.162604 g.162604  ORF g.162604 m.162604 type:complete len:194 (-) comp18074_c0_seq8:1084-1665(-)